MTTSPTTTLLEAVFSTQEREDTSDLFDAFIDDEDVFTETQPETGPLVASDGQPSPQETEQDTPARYLSDEEKQALLERVRAGDRQARETLIVDFNSYCRALAARFTAAYAWANPRIEFDDLVQIGILAVISKFDVALTKENLFSYLIATSRYAMVMYCFHYAPLIERPRLRKPVPFARVVSLNAPVGNANAKVRRTLADVLPAPSGPSKQERRYTALYEALEALSPRQRETIQRHYGLGCAPESLPVISRSFQRTGRKKYPHTAETHEKRAMVKLRTLLAHNATVSGEVSA